MKSSFEKLPGSKINLEIELTAPEFLEYFKTVYDQALAEVEVKGFRKGMAPRELADSGVDKDKVFHEAATRAIKAMLKDASAEHGWLVIDQPKVEIVDASPGEKEVGLKYRAEFTVFPEVALGNYRKTAKQVLAEKRPADVREEEITRALKWLRESRASETLVNRAAQNGDLIEADIAGTVDGKPIPGATLKKDRFMLGESRFIPGFDPNLAGHSAGEELHFSVTAPADYWQKELRDKEIAFTVRVNGVYERNIPELTDAFAQGLGPNLKTADDVRKNIVEGLRAEQEGKEVERLRLKMLEEISRDARIDLPEIMVERTLDHMLSEVKAMMPNSGKSDAELRAALRDRAVAQVRQNLVLQQIAKSERLEPTEEEVQAELERVDPARNRERGSRSVSNGIDAEKHYDYSYGVVQERKVFAFLERQD